MPTDVRTLRRPMPLDPVAFPEATKDLTSAERGNLVLLALCWWSTGALPSRPADLGRVLGTDPQAAKAMAERLAPFFGLGSYLQTLRAGHCAKAERRARAGRAGMASRWGHSASA